MEFDWSEQQIALRDEAAAFARESLNAGDGEPSFRRELWQRAAGFGVQGSFVSRELGGQGRDVLTTILMLEGIGHGCRDNGFTLGLNGHMWAVMEPILRFGTEAQRQQYVPGLCVGKLIGAHAMTEAASGSDAFSLATSAKRVDGGYVLDGHKVYIGLAPVCDIALVFASTNPEQRRWGLSAFIVDASSDGFEAGPIQSKMGVNGSPLGEITLTECFVPEENRLGPEGAGASIFNHSMEWERSFIFTSHVGAMQRQLDEAIAYAGDRQVFGQRIDEYQSVSNRIADMKLRLETAKLLLYRCAWQKDKDRAIPMDAALAKLHISESFVQSSIDTIRVHGGVGYLSEHGVERDLRDAMGGVIYSGTSDIQRQLIARLLKD
ncbi:MAG: acyl-CoA/acyl-ACP dehydrogenase [Gammaproteobacteria bacterium]|nr:acyl-CoA/acyl-ACP dehydrogenase [Gammaproteobacteria bacterium]